MNTALLIQTDDRGVCTLTLNKPEKHNAFDAQLISELLSALENIDRDPLIRILVITGKGKSFSSGADLDWMRTSVNFSEETNRQDALQLAKLMRVLSDLSRPTIARVNGPAYGGGLGLIACCDIAIGSNEAVFAFTEVKLGLVPAVISPYILMAIGPRHSKRLFMTAKAFDSQQALELQLLHQVVPEDELNHAIEEEINLLLNAGPEALRACKKLVPRLNNDQIDMELAALIAALRVSTEGQEGLISFLEKRKPSWAKG